MAQVKADEIEDETASALPQNGKNENLSNPPQIKVYRRRWAMLSIFVLVSTSNAFQWIQFSIITSIIMRYYDVDSTTVDWTSLVYMIVYIPLIFPGAWIMDKMGLRWTLIFGALGTTVGAWIKVLGVAPGLFHVALIGQTITAMSQVFILGVPPNVAAVWFGPEEVSSACAIGVFGNQLGVALGFLLPPMLVKNHEKLEDIGADLSQMSYILAGVCSVLTLSVLLVFQAKPPSSPNAARVAVSLQSPTGSLNDFVQSIKRICSSRAYILLLFTYGLNAGVFYAMSTLLNQTLVAYFPGEEESGGLIGLTIVACGMLGSLVCGIILDRTHRFKETTLVVYVLALVGMLAYTFNFHSGMIAVTFVTAGAVGFFMTGYLPVGFEFAAELTYPEPEVTSSGLLNASAQVFGILLTMAGGWMLRSYGDLVCNGILSAALGIGAFLTLLIRSDLKRQAANQKAAFQPVDLPAVI